MTALIFTPDRNSKLKDFSGAFEPESIKFAALHGADADDIVRVRLSGTNDQQREQILVALRSHPPADIVAFFCHGWQTGIQLGFKTLHVGELAKAIVYGSLQPSEVIGHESHERLPRVALYACSTGGGPGGGDGGFADTLRDAMCKLGAVNCRVDAHDRKGHSTQNPYVRRYEGGGSSVGGTGGQWIVDPAKAQLFRKWRIALVRTDLVYRFPLMTTAEIHQELLAAPAQS